MTQVLVEVPEKSLGAVRANLRFHFIKLSSCCNHIEDSSLLLLVRGFNLLRKEMRFAILLEAMW